MKYSQLFTKTRKNISAEETSKNAQLLTRGGFVDRLQAGVYTYLPLGLRVLRKIENIIRDEMNEIGGQEILMPALHPKANYEKTGRWDTIDVLFRFTSHFSGNEYAFGPTHEEIITPTCGKFIASHRDLPFSAYQIQTKFRDEKRAKSGVMRGREFLMKDLYSFHATETDLDKFYEKATAAYKKIFEKLGIGDKTLFTFASGGTFSKFSHEFQTLTDAGEDEIFICEKCQIGHNSEVFDENLIEKRKCVNCGNTDLKKEKAAEVGNIFKLMTKFSDTFGVKFTDEDGKQKPVLMGCYGIGISRLLGVVTEIFNDKNGIIWPENIAPFKIHLISLNGAEKEAQKLYDNLKSKNIEVLWDDRPKARPGEKFGDADLIGCPWRVVISPRSLENGGIEIKKRTEKDGKIIKIEKLLAEITK